MVMGDRVVRRGLLAAGLVVGLAGSAWAQPGQRVIGLQADEGAYHIERTSDGGYIETGYLRPASAGLADVQITRHAPDGSILWDKLFGSADSNDIGYCVQQTLDGGFIVACETNFGGSTLGIGLIRLDPAGTVLWARIYPGTPHQDIVVSPLPGVAVRELRDASGFIVVGHRVVPNAGQRGVLIRTDPVGNPLFIREYMDAVAGSQTQITFTDIRESRDAAGAQVFNIVGTIAQLIVGATRDRDIFLMQTSGGGVPLTARRTGSVQPFVQETGDGLDQQGPGLPIYVAGRTDFGVTGGTGSQLVWMSGAGVLVDVRRFRQLETAYGAVRVDSAGDILFCGHTPTATGAPTAFLHKIDAATGNTDWNWNYNWGVTNTADGLCINPGVGPLPDTYTLAGGTTGNGYGATDIYLVRTTFLGGTGNSCPDQQITLIADRPQLQQIGVSIESPILQGSTFWQGERPVDFRDTLLCPRPCDADVNCDGNVDQDDVNCLINVVAGNPGCECINPDFNNDGNVDQDDVTALINVIAGGGCP